ncbi:MAG: carboxyl transferase domain-containing protein [Pseudomonadota bacterium]
MLEKIAQLRALEARAEAESEKRRPRFEARGQLTPRERLGRLLDAGLPFLRLHSLAGYGIDGPPEKTVPGASILVGIGFVSGARCLIWVDDSGIKAGAFGPKTLPVVLRIQEIAKRQKLPLIHLVESAGANLMEYQVEGWSEGGALFRNLAQLSAQGLPVISVLHGPSTAGGAYMPGLSDVVVGVRGNGMAALAGAALVAAATGEQSDDRAVGGAEMHAEVSGLVEHLAEDDAHALEIARDCVARLGWNRGMPAPPPPVFDEPLHAPETLAGVVPMDPATPYEAREVVARLVDGSDFEDFQPRFGVSTVCARASIHGQPVGMLANNGPIDPAGAQKAAHFLQICDQTDLPVVFLHNTTGYIVGAQSERAGMIKHGAKMIQAVANLRVPKIALHVGASYGAGNYGMCGWAYEPDFLFAWPNARTGVMGGAQAAGTMSMVARAGAKRAGREVDEVALAAQEAAIKNHFEAQADAFATSGRVLDHGVIDPRDSRRVLAFCLETVAEARSRTLRPNSFGVARM